jgi:EAL domain-containing protein (putative c-di-GMP-specific phosphodiesterase class I)
MFELKPICSSILNLFLLDLMLFWTIIYLSNYTNIIELEPNYLKIDGSLIKDIANNKNSKNIVISIVSFAKASGIKTIAKFVSNKEIANIYSDIGVDESQGYYFFEPEPEKELKLNSSTLFKISFAV